MNLQELIQHSDLGMGLPHIKAFFLGAIVADRPMSFDKAAEELLAEHPDTRSKLGPELKKFWEELQTKKDAELGQLFNEFSDLETSKEQLDFFLTALTLAGTNSETAKKKEVGSLIEDLEDMVMDLDDYLADSPTEAEGEKLKDALLNLWQSFTEAKQ